MGHNVTIGGERLGSGKKMKAYLHNYERSTHDMGFVWRSTIAPGTLIPFWTEVALPGDTFDVNLNVDILTKPTIGPLFGSYKIQLDVFQIPMRLYQGKLHMNMLGIGMDMSKVALPQLDMNAEGVNQTRVIDNFQVNPSSIFSYLGIRGLGINNTGSDKPVKRKFNAIPYLGYWDIYKNYYANKQEEIGAMVHKDTTPYNPGITANTMKLTYNVGTGVIGDVNVPIVKPADPVPYTRVLVNQSSTWYIAASNAQEVFDPAALIIFVETPNTGGVAQPATPHPATDLYDVWEIQTATNRIIGSSPNMSFWDRQRGIGWAEYHGDLMKNPDTEPKILTFPLTAIDDMRKGILAWTSDAPFMITPIMPAPYGPPLAGKSQPDTSVLFSKQFNQEGLALKTYQSDLFNNWISTEWIDGPDGISEITAIDTSGGSFTIDELNMSKKVYDMLNRIAISGGSYDDWLDAVYTHERQRSAENPMYLGGLIRNLVFQEVVSNSATEGEPLGTLAGRGTLGHKKKGGHIIAKVDEPSYLMGIISLTPNVDYSQGNKWDVNLQTLNDLHKPALDEIGYQDLTTDQMAWWDTIIENVTGIITYRSAGKQPAWLNYMTNVNVVKGNFADSNQEMFMVLNRTYEPDFIGNNVTISDLTTYIDPTKYNHIFADTRRDAQNFWAQIGLDITARRKMSAKIMPNL